MAALDNLRERLDPNLANYIAGFVDGEGSFHVAIQRNPSTKATWQLVPEFHVSQHVSSKSVLELLRDTLECGYVKPNHRENPKDQTYAYVVRARADLVAKIIPFFQEFQLRTCKRMDFEIFTEIVLGMQMREHHTTAGLIRLLKLAFSMNRFGKYRRMSVDEIISDLTSKAAPGIPETKSH